MAVQVVLRRPEPSATPYCQIQGLSSPELNHFRALRYIRAKFPGFLCRLSSRMAKLLSGTMLRAMHAIRRRVTKYGTCELRG